MITIENFTQKTVNEIAYLELKQSFLGDLEFVTIEPKTFGGFYLNSNRFNFQCETLQECLDKLNEQIVFAQREVVVLIQPNSSDAFSVKVEFDVVKEGKTFLITNKELDITAWGDSLEEAIDAFKFTVEATYINYFLEKDENLTDKAKILKNKLTKMIIK